MPTRPWLRWLVPLAAVLAIAATTLVAGNASADEKLPPRSAEQLLVDLQQADIDGLSGMVQQSADLGIPALPGVSEQGSGFSSLISGTHTLRVAYAAPTSRRWPCWETSRSRRSPGTAPTCGPGPAGTTRSPTPPSTRGRRSRRDGGIDKDLPADAPKTPQEAASGFLRSASDTTTSSVATDTMVAGRAAYELVLQPKQTGSLLSSVRIAVDGTEHVALRVQVFAGEPGRARRRDRLHRGRLRDPGRLGVRVHPAGGCEGHRGAARGPRRGSKAERGRGDAREQAEPTVVGEGWTTVVVGKLPADEPSSASRGRRTADLQAYLAQLPEVSGTWGSGRLLAGTAFSVVITDDGRVAAGAVGPDSCTTPSGEPGTPRRRHHQAPGRCHRHRR